MDMTIKEAILKSLEELNDIATHKKVLEYIVSKKYYAFNKGKTPEATISAQLGDFIRKNDSRVKRVKGKGGIFLYYLAKYEQDLNLDNFNLSVEEKKVKPNKKILIMKEICINCLVVI